MTEHKKTVVISVGGSLIFPDDNIDASFLLSIKDFLINHSDVFNFFIVCGGGKICRKYQHSAKEVADTKEEDLDHLGIRVTHLNAFLMTTILGDHCRKEVATNYNNLPSFDKKPIIVSGGWKPGFSTDTGAVMAAKFFKTNRVVNLSNIDFVYTADPKKEKQAKPIKKISWEKYRKMIPGAWTHGLNTPFDPIASKKAEENNVEVSIINGKNLPELEKYLTDKPFKGTLIKN